MREFKIFRSQFKYGFGNTDHDGFLKILSKSKKKFRNLEAKLGAFSLKIN